LRAPCPTAVFALEDLDVVRAGHCVGDFAQPRASAYGAIMATVATGLYALARGWAKSPTQ